MQAIYSPLRAEFRSIIEVQLRAASILRTNRKNKGNEHRQSALKIFWVVKSRIPVELEGYFSKAFALEEDAKKAAGITSKNIYHKKYQAQAQKSTATNTKPPMTLMSSLTIGVPNPTVF